MKAIFLLFIFVFTAIGSEVQVDDIKRIKELPTKMPDIVRGKKALQKQNEKLKKVVNTIYEYNAYHDDEHLRYDVPPIISDKTTNTLRANTMVTASDNQVSIGLMDQPKNVLRESSRQANRTGTIEQIFAI